MRADSLRHEFVEFIPGQLEEGVVYVSVEYATVVHLCACGCGEKVVTPLTPTDWALRYDGESVSLSPSIGNHAFRCRSHYWIEHDRVRWSRKMSPREVEAVRDRGRMDKVHHYDDKEGTDLGDAGTVPSLRSRLRGIWSRMFRS